MLNDDLVGQSESLAAEAEPPSGPVDGADIQSLPATSADAEPAAGAAIPLQKFEPNRQSGQLSAFPAYFVVDHCLLVGPRLALLQGWLTDPGRRVVRVVARAASALGVDVIPGPCVHARTDVDNGIRPVFLEYGLELQEGTTQGFFACVDVGDGPAAVEVQVRLDSGEAFEWTVTPRSNPQLRDEMFSRRALSRWASGALGVLLRHMDAAELPSLRQMASEVLASSGDSIAAPGSKARMAIDFVARVGRGLFVVGWGVDSRGQAVESLLALSTVSDGVGIANHLGRIPRQDVVQLLAGQFAVLSQDLGFLAWIPDVSDASASEPWVFMAADGAGGAMWQRAKVLSGLVGDDVTRTLLHSVPLHAADFRDIYERHTGPALEAHFSARRQVGLPTVKTVDFGEVPFEPEISIVVPLYGRWDFIEHQIALFRHDPSLRRHELIYFVDDPGIYDAIVQYWRSTWPLYEYPFRLAFCGRNLGFAGANNAAVSVARGRRVLLLNSDVIPSQAGWLDGLSQALDQSPRAGVVGAVLMYGDGSVQHAGMNFERYPHWGNLWTNLHPGKGWPASWVEDSGPVEVPALTGACLLLDRSLYVSLGGLDEGFIRGDFEDSDLCLKIREQGLLPYLVPSVRLYHLERQSQDINAKVDTRMLLTVFNCWRHTQRWDARLTQLTQSVSAQQEFKV